MFIFLQAGEFDVFECILSSKLPDLSRVDKKTTVVYKVHACFSSLGGGVQSARLLFKVHVCFFGEVFPKP